jgi:hypothetical protein
MKKSRRVIRNTKRRRTHKKKGGDCGCNKKKAAYKIYGGYGEASYQGGINNSILPMNRSLGSSVDPGNSSNMESERFMKFNGGRRRRMMMGGMTVDPLLGDSIYKNPVLSAGTSVGAVDAARKIMGQRPLL